MTLLPAAVPSAALPHSASTSLVVRVRVSVRIHLAFHPPVFNCRCPPSAVAELLEAPEVVVTIHELQFDAKRSRGSSLLHQQILIRSFQLRAVWACLDGSTLGQKMLNLATSGRAGNHSVTENTLPGLLKWVFAWECIKRLRLRLRGLFVLNFRLHPAL